MTQTIRKIDRANKIIEIWSHPNNPNAKTTDDLSSHSYDVEVIDLTDLLHQSFPNLEKMVSTGSCYLFDLMDLIPEPDKFGERYCDRGHELMNLYPDFLAVLGGMKYKITDSNGDQVYYAKNLREAYDCGFHYSC